MRYLIFLCIIFLAVQCDKAEGDDLLVAKVYNKNLYESDLIKQLGEGYNSVNKDELIDSWIRKQLLLRNAKLSSRDKKEIEELTENYKESLTIQKYKEQIVGKRLNRQISDKELKDRYEILKSDFQLRLDIYKIQLYVVDVNHFDILDLKSFFKKEEYEEFYNSINGQIELEVSDSTRWKSWSAISQYIPKELLKEEDIEASKDYILENEKFVFFLRIHDKVDKNDTAPLSYMNTMIEQSIIERRKEKLLDDYSLELYKSGLKNNKIQIN